MGPEEVSILMAVFSFSLLRFVSADECFILFLTRMAVPPEARIPGRSVL